MVAFPKPVPPFLRRGCATRGMMSGMLICLTVTAFHFAARYDPFFAARYLGYLAWAAAVEFLYRLLNDGRAGWPGSSTFVTAALLVLSVPAHMPALHVGVGILVAVWFGKLTTDRRALRVNPMLLGRLFMMLVFSGSIQEWLNPRVAIDALSSATPLGLFAAEKVAYDPWRLWWGQISGNWEGLYAIVPGSPGDVMPPLALAGALLLYLAGILDWRPAVFYVAGFALGCRWLGLPVLFELMAGSVFFTAAYIVTDPRSMPGSKAGRALGGLLAGLLNAAVRAHGYYPEGVVIAVLSVNLLSPTLDRLVFTWRGLQLRRRARAVV